VEHDVNFIPDNEPDYLRQLKEGSKFAFECLYNRFSGKLYHFIFRVTRGNTWQTEELVQRTFIKVWENRERINPDKPFISYLCAIAKNMLLNELEHQAVEFVFREYIKQNETVEACSTDEAIDLKFLEELFDELASRLPPARKQIFLLRKQKDYSVKEIANELNLAETTVQTQLSKALVFMKEELSKYYFLILMIISI
jgi:RNA polymerase sigma-70 factor (ECF subfamily)